MEIKANKIFSQLDASKTKVNVFQGGSRSGKTFNILIWLIATAAQSAEPLMITICRATMPALKGSAFRDFIEILNVAGLYDQSNLNKSELTYKLINSTFEFISIDQPQKIRGRKRDILFINEANEIDFESWVQLSIRTTGKVILDYNPSMAPDHWIFEQVMKRDDSELYKSTYKDNPFLSQSIIDEIERLQTIDENYWKIYGLGERGDLKGIVFTNWTHTATELDPGRSWYGLDFGYTNDPAALIRVQLIDGELYLQELIYSTGLTNKDLSERMTAMGITSGDAIYADSAEPKSIDELIGFGFNVHGADKGKDSIMNGINVLKQYRINVTDGSLNLIKELNNYKFEADRNGNVLNKPVDAFNHAIDAVRYAVTMRLRRGAIQRKQIFMPSRNNRM